MGKSCLLLRFAVSLSQGQSKFCKNPENSFSEGGETQNKDGSGQNMFYFTRNVSAEVLGAGCQHLCTLTPPTLNVLTNHMEAI